MNMSIIVIVLIILVVLSIFVSKLSDYVDRKRDKEKSGGSLRHPVSTYNENTPILVMWISTCASYIMANNVNYLKSIGKFSKFDTKKAGDYVLEYITLILAFLEVYKIKPKEGWENLWIKQISANFETSNSINENNIKILFEKRVIFYKTELEVLKSTRFPLPNEIISQTLNPMVFGELSHRIPVNNGFTLQENLYMWEIIGEEVSKLMDKISKHGDVMYMNKADEYERENV